MGCSGSRPARPVEVRPQPPPPAPQPIPHKPPAPQGPTGPAPAAAVPRPVAVKPQEETAEELIKRARRELGVDCVNHYNFAVSGQSGVGKSSFINGIRSIPDNQSGAAGVGQTECTQVVKSYPHPKFPHVVLWDLPGAGTTSHPAATYFSDKKLYAFDAILILTSDRFFEVDLEIAKAALQYGKPCAFVRTKCDVAIGDVANNCGIPAMEAGKRLRKDVENSFQSNLKKMGLADCANKIPLFFVSSKAFSQESAYWYWVSVSDDDDDDAPPTRDKSLPFMDESNLLKFLLDSSKARAKNPDWDKSLPSNLLKVLRDSTKPRAKNPA